jgi:hypothetical protein
VKTFFIIVTYWTGRGSSNPHSSSMFSTSTGVAFLPARLWAGFCFGTTMKKTKTITETAKRTAIIPTRRRATKRIT